MKDTAIGIVQLIAVIIFIGGSLLISGMLGGGDQGKGSKDNNTAKELIVNTIDVAPEPYAITFQTTGTIQARAEIAIVPQVSGRIIKINDAFFEGGAFDADEILFEIEPLDFELEARALEAQVAQARTAYNLEEAQSKAALSEWQQFNPDKPAPALVARKPQKAEAWANLKAAKAQLENAQLDLKRTKFSMPFKGRVLSSDLELGQFVTAGQGYGLVFDEAALEIRTSLQDKQLQWLNSAKANNGDHNITVTATYLGEEKEYKAYLKRGAATLDQQTRFANVTLGFEKPTQGLLPGIFVDITINGPQENGVTRIPSSALQSGNIIWRVDENNTLQGITPDILFTETDHVAVKNINGRTTIVSGKLSGATQGTTVKTQNDLEKEAALEDTYQQDVQKDNPEKDTKE